MCFLWGGIHTHADTLSWRLIPYICCMCVLCSLATVWCWCVSSLRLFELLESKPSVAVKVLLDSLSQAKWGYTQTVAATWARKLLMNCFQLFVWRWVLLLIGQCNVVRPTLDSWLRDIIDTQLQHLIRGPFVACHTSLCLPTFPVWSLLYTVNVIGFPFRVPMDPWEFEKRSMPKITENGHYRHLKSLNWFNFSLCLILVNSHFLDVSLLQFHTNSQCCKSNWLTLWTYL